MQMNSAITINDDETSVSFDEDGFLVEPSLWNEQLAKFIADMEGITALTNEHWTVINHIREKYFHYGSLPTMRLVCKATGLEKNKIYKLFGGCLVIWRIAGLPNPGEEARTYMN